MTISHPPLSSNQTDPNSLDGDGNLRSNIQNHDDDVAQHGREITLVGVCFIRDIIDSVLASIGIRRGILIAKGKLCYF